MRDTGREIEKAIQIWSDNRDRSLQKAGGQLGMSDVGGCREYGRFIVTQEPASDHRRTWPADVGTAVDLILKDAMDYYDHEVLLNHKTTVTFPSGAVITGHPDMVDPEGDELVDFKSKDGLATVRRNGPTGQQWTQVMGYAKGCIEQGHLTENCTVTLAFVDRSGRESDIVTFSKQYDPMALVEADHWIEDVTYAVKHGENAAKDKPIDWCRDWCEFFTTCRGADAYPEGLIQDPEAIDAVQQYQEAAKVAKEAARLKDEAKSRLVGVQGSTGEWSVKWTHVNESEIPATFRKGYDRLTIARVK